MIETIKKYKWLIVAILAILLYAVGYLSSVGIVWIVFVALEKAGVIALEYNVWWVGLAFYLIWLIFKGK